MISSARGAARVWEPAPSAERLPPPPGGLCLAGPALECLPVTLSPVQAARGAGVSGVHSTGEEGHLSLGREQGEEVREGG